jgi:hypothetical protein
MMPIVAPQSERGKHRQPRPGQPMSASPQQPVMRDCYADGRDAPIADIGIAVSRRVNPRYSGSPAFRSSVNRRS